MDGVSIREKRMKKQGQAGKFYDFTQVDRAFI